MTESVIPSHFREPSYRARRFQNWIIIGFLYSLFYMTRYNFAANAPTLQQVFGWTKSDLGVFETMLPLVYGLAVVLNGPIADKIGGKKAFLIGAVGVILMNFIFGAMGFAVLQPSVWEDSKLIKPSVFIWGDKELLLALLATCWSINGYFQAFGALSIVKINAQWFHIRERGTFAAIFGILIRFGLILAFSGTPLFAYWFGWQWAFWGPAILTTIVFILTIFFVKDSPKEAGYEGRDTGDGDDMSSEKVKLKEVLTKVFASPVMWMIGISSMMIGFVRRSIVDAWYPLYFKEVYGVSTIDTAYQITAWGIAILGILGGFAFGVTSDRVYGGRRAPVIVFGFIGMVVSLLLFFLSDYFKFGPYVASALIMLLSFFVNGAHGMVGGAASMDFGGRKAAATAAGLIDGFQYLTSALNPLFLSALIFPLGWQAWQLWPIPFAIIGALVMSRLWNTLPKGRSAH